MGPEALAMFRQHDIDDDGSLSLMEFEPLAHILVDVNVGLQNSWFSGCKIRKFYFLEISPDSVV